MFKVLIAEDEIPVRNKIIESIDWEDIGFEMAYAAADGQDALNFLEEDDVDLIITDIYMPFIDGIELVKKVRERNNYCKVVFLTGYNEFEYAKEAIELEASKYLLKPITKDELREVLGKLHDEIAFDINDKKNLCKLEMEYEHNQLVLKEKLLNDILFGYMPLERIQDSCDHLGCNLDADYYSVGVLAFVNKEAEISKRWFGDYSLLHYAIHNICKEIAMKSNQENVLLRENGRIIILFKSNDIDNIKIVASNVLQEMINTIRHLYGMNICAGLGDVYTNLSEIMYSHKDALTALDYKVIVGLNRVIVKSDMDKICTKSRQVIDEILYKIEIAVRLNNEEDIQKNINLLINTVKFNRMSIDEFKGILITLITKLYATCNQINEELEEKLVLEFSVIEKIFKMENTDSIKYELYAICYNLGVKVKKAREGNQVNLIKMANQFIKDNYHDPDLNLNTISTELSVSSSYFIRQFKKVNGQTFLEYLTKYRMNRAKELLRNSTMKVFEISEKVGYEDPHYFSYNFRKNVGKSPLKYRKG